MLGTASRTAADQINLARLAHLASWSGRTTSPNRSYSCYYRVDDKVCSACKNIRWDATSVIVRDW
jgi:hypothetical protein